MLLGHAGASTHPRRRPPARLIPLLPLPLLNANEPTPLLPSYDPLASAAAGCIEPEASGAFSVAPTQRKPQQTGHKPRVTQQTGLPSQLPLGADAGVQSCKPWRPAEWQAQHHGRTPIIWSALQHLAHIYSGSRVPARPRACNCRAWRPLGFRALRLPAIHMGIEDYDS